MKKIILICILIFLSFNNFGQELSQDTSKKDYKNVIGLDITGLINQMRSYNYYPIDDYYYPYYNYYYFSNYILTYKRISKNNALRAGIGGNISNSDNTNNDTIKSNSSSNSINIGIGYERYGYIAKKWTFYYGFDLIGTYSTYKYQYDYNSGNNRKETSKTYSYGVSPLFGLMLRFNKRISIATETSFDVLYHQTIRETTYSSASYNKSKYESSGLYTQYHSPSNIILRIQF
jgi:hypothetical protein